MRSAAIPLSELLRPQQFRDLALPQRDVNRLQGMLDTMTPMNMIFYGPPGLGKTSAGRIFIKARGSYGVVEINGSHSRGIDTARHLESTVTAIPFTPGLKIILIDEADCLPAKIQASLRGLIELSSSNCRFIMTANDISKISAPIQSRIMPISFEVGQADRKPIITRLQTRLAERLKDLGVPFDVTRLNQIVSSYFPDLRGAVMRLEYEFCFQTQLADDQ